MSEGDTQQDTTRTGRVYLPSEPRFFIPNDRTVLSAHLLGLAEAARLLGVRKTHVARLTARGLMPDPIARLECGPVYDRSEIAPLARRLRAERRARASRSRWRAHRDARLFIAGPDGDPDAVALMPPGLDPRTVWGN